MIAIFILGFLAAAAQCRPQNDGTIHTDLIPERRQADAELTDEMVAAGSDRIVGGSEVYPRYKYPYQVYMQVNPLFKLVIFRLLICLPNIIFKN